jgi:predicted AAA+ superfamily ATPase
MLFTPKTTLLYDLLLTEEYRRLVLDPKLFQEEILRRSKQITHVIVDEVQRIPELLNVIHYILEQPNAPYFCLSGSSARKLKRGKGNLLGGRAFLRNLYPLTYVELKEQFYLNKALNLGTLPSVYLAKSENEAKDMLRAYVDIYLKEEIQAEALTRKLDNFIRFLDLAADSNGNIINYSTISRECGVSYNTVKDYFQILEDTLVGFFLSPYAKSVRKRLIQHPKFYFFDTGVARAFKRTLNVELMPQTHEYGRAFEHFLIAEIMRLNSYKQKDLRFSFYGTANHAEVDLIIETPLKEIFAIEIKSSQRPEIEALRGLKSFKEVCPKAKLYCLSTAQNKRKVDECWVLPWQEIFKEIGL